MSLSTLYTAVNNAWRKSLYPSSASCVSVMEWNDDNDESNASPYDMNNTLSALWSTCAPCVARTKLISITGGMCVCAVRV